MQNSFFFTRVFLTLRIWLQPSQMGLLRKLLVKKKRQQFFLKTTKSLKTFLETYHFFASWSQEPLQMDHYSDSDSSQKIQHYWPS